MTLVNEQVTIERLEGIVAGVRRRVRAWIWAEEGLRGLSVGLGAAVGVAGLARVTPVHTAAWAAPIALAAWVAVRGALARRFSLAEAALLLDCVAGADGEVFTAAEKRDPWIAARAVARAEACRVPLLPRGVPRALWVTVLLGAVLAATPFLPEGQAVATPRLREAQAERIEKAADLAAPDPALGERLRALAREVRGGGNERLAAAVDELSSAVDVARRRGAAAEVIRRTVANVTGGAADARGAAEKATSSAQAAEAMEKGIAEAQSKFAEGERPSELADASRALEAHDAARLGEALTRLMDPAQGLAADTAERLAARLDAIRADLGGAAATANAKGTTGAAGAGTAKAASPAAAVPLAGPACWSEPIDLGAARRREEALKRPTWPSELDPVVREYFGGAADVRR